MSKEFPLYPKLTEEGEKQAQAIMNSFKPRIKDLVNELMGDLYCDVAYHIESDSWDNFRNELMDGFRGYTAGASTHQYDFKELRQAIYANHKDQIVKDLNQDLVKENAALKEQIESLYEQMAKPY